MSPATFREVRRYICGDVQSNVIAQAASQLRMKLVESCDGSMTLTIRPNIWSWGERVTIALGSVDGSTVVDVTSSCVLRTQIADWGKNERNVRRLFKEIDNLLGDRSGNEQCVLCGACGYLLVGIPAGRCPECGRPWSPNDKPYSPEVSTFKNAAVLAVAFTVAEVVLAFLLDLSGLFAYLPWLAFGVRSTVRLLGMNLLVLFLIVGLHRLVKRRAQRRGR